MCSLNVFVFVFSIFCFLVRSYLLITLIKYLKTLESKVTCINDHSLKVFSKYLCLSVGQVMFSHHSDQMSQRSQVSWVTHCFLWSDGRMDIGRNHPSTSTFCKFLARGSREEESNFTFLLARLSRSSSMCKTYLLFSSR